MNCSNCNAPIAEGTRFCTICGQEVSEPQPAPAPTPAPVNVSLRKKEKYCKRCGHPLDGKNCCTGCGRQYFNSKVGTAIFCVVTSMLLVLSSTLCVLLWLENNTLSKENKGYKDVNKQLEFYENNTAVVGDDGSTLYHKYGCQRLYTDNGVWLYDIEEAESKGFIRCEDCH